MKKYLRYFLLAAIGGVAIYSLILFERFSMQTFNQREEIFNHIHNIRTLDESLDFEILKDSFFLYLNYDNITHIQKKLQKEIETLDKLLKDQPVIQNTLVGLKEKIAKKAHFIEYFKRYNSAIKNSTSHIAVMLKKIFSYDLHQARYEQQLIDTVTTIYLAKNSMDPDFLSSISKKLEKLRKFHFADKELARYHSILISHIEVFVRDFPQYSKILYAILSSTSKKELEKFSQIVRSFFDAQVQRIDLSYRLLILFYLMALGLIIFYMIRLDKENEELQRLQQKLSNLVLIDDLTKLYNRRAYKKDVRSVKRTFFALVNIDGFKHYNDFYGIAFGDHILRQAANIIKQSLSQYHNAKIYRVGADEFGILIDEQEPIDDRSFARSIIEAFHTNPITFKKITLTVSVSVAITRKRPLLETADLTMKHIKKERRFKYLTYKDNLGFMQEIKENIRRSKIIKEAIEEQRLVPFFQPIVDNTTLSISKYEVLARLKHHNGSFESIFTYLPIVQELGLYEALTRQIIEQATNVAIDNSIRISVNISMKDIENSQFLIYLGQLFKKYPDLAKRLSFEILESETLKDYEAVKNFISIIRSQGGEVGIDDFGNGYSNFAHIFNLDIDFIKIDGSLIREIDHNKTARMIVENIVRIAKSLEVKTIAEFISNKEIQEIVMQMGIDYSQGFFLGEPRPMS